MQLLADMGVSQRVVEWLRSAGHDVVHLRDEGLQRLPNGDIFRKASQEQRIILTFDLDFGEIVAASGGRVVSVVVFRLRNTGSDFVIKRLDTVLAQSSTQLLQGQLWSSRTAVTVCENCQSAVERSTSATRESPCSSAPHGICRTAGKRR